MKFKYFPDIDDVQREILTRLAVSLEPMRYSDLRSEDVENDRYLYHLKYLQKNDLIEKKENGYSLTQKGVILISNFDASGNLYNLFKMSIALHIFKRDFKQMLLQRRLRHPFYGDVLSGIAGKINWGERIEDTCKRKLMEETGLTGDAVVVGTMRKIRRNKNDVVLEDTLYYHCYVEDPEGLLIEKNTHGENFWVDSEKALHLMQSSADFGDCDLQVYERLIKKDFSLFTMIQDREIERY